MAKVVSLRPDSEPLLISEFSVPFGDEVYTVRRAVDRETKRGFVTIYDSDRRAVLVFSSRYPDELIHQLIVGWRAGYTRGLERGRRERSQEHVS
jgi:ribose 1,5-bisphosphokinase PhnN